MQYEPGDLIQLGTASRRLGVDRRTLRRWVSSGRVETVNVDGRVFVPTTEIGRLQDNRKIKEKRQCQSES